MEAQAREIYTTLVHKCHIAYTEQYNTGEDVNRPEGEKRGREETFKARKLGSAERNRSSEFVDWWHWGRLSSRQVVPISRNIGHS
jgi:hypothetical protein